MQSIIDAVNVANPLRHHKNIHRRLVKVFEELGEISEAYLNVTSAANAKDKSYDDLREEIADTLIVAIDVALTPLEDGSEEVILDEVPTTFSDRDFWTVLGAIGKETGSAMTLLAATGWKGAAAARARRAFEFAVELAFMPLPDQQELTAAERFENLRALVDMKLLKWEEGRRKQREATREVDDAA